MNFDTDFSAIPEDQPPTVWKSRRRRRVRHSYPESLIELVGHLRSRISAREIAAALDVTLSSIYRWAPIAESTATGESANATAAYWQSLISRCRDDGFAIPRSIVSTLASCSPRKPPADTAYLRLHPLPASEKTQDGTRAPVQSGQQVSAKERPNLETARLMIERDYFRDIDSKALAAAAGLSRFRFIHAFTETYGISPHQYLLRTRIEAAKKILATSRETIDVVAAATGFRSGACLNRAFTRVEGHCVSRVCRVLGTRV